MSTHGATKTPTRRSTSAAAAGSASMGGAAAGAAPAAGARVRVLVRVKPLLGASEQDAGSVLSVRQYEAPAPTPMAVTAPTPVPTPVTGAAGRPAGMGVMTLTDTRFASPEVTEYSFPAVYGPHTSQAALFAAEVAPVVAEVLQGGSACMFAYGPTGTGKTHTLQGPAQDPGIVPRVAQALLSVPGLAVTVGFVEVYQERLYDLLVAPRPAAGARASTGRPTMLTSGGGGGGGGSTARAGPQRKALMLLEDSDGHVHVSGLKEVSGRV